MRRVRIAHDHASEGIAFHLAEQMQAVEPLQVVEPVAVLQVLHLRLEDEVEGRAQHAAEGQDLFGQAADPQVDIVETGRGDATGQVSPGAFAVEEVDRSVASAARMTRSSTAVLGSPKTVWSVPKMMAIAASRLPSTVVAPVIR